MFARANLLTFPRLGQWTVSTSSTEWYNPVGRQESPNRTAMPGGPRPSANRLRVQIESGLVFLSATTAPKQSALWHYRSKERCFC